MPPMPPMPHTTRKTKKTPNTERRTPNGEKDHESVRGSVRGVCAADSEDVKGAATMVGRGQQAPPFSVDWFSEHAPEWTKWLGGMRGESLKGESKGESKGGVHALMVGVYEGLSAEWMLLNVLTDRASSLTAVDGYEYPPCVHDRNRPVWNPDARAVFVGRVLRGPHGFRVDDRTGAGRPAALELARLALEGRAFDIVCVDATAGAQEALQELVMCWPLLKRGGVLVVTNYTFSREHDSRCPRRGIDAFIDAYAHDLSVLKHGWHVFLKRRKRALPRPPCRSEYFEPHPAQPPCSKSSQSKSKSKSSGGKKKKSARV